MHFLPRIEKIDKAWPILNSSSIAAINIAGIDIAECPTARDRQATLAGQRLLRAFRRQASSGARGHFS
jgi:hypothetical protein